MPVDSTRLPDIAALYRAHGSAMRAVAASVLVEGGRLDDVDDVIQEVLGDLLERPPTTQVLNWEAWLVRSVKNRAYDRLRSADHRHKGELPEWDTDRTPSTEEDVFLVDEAQDTALLMGHVWDALAVLDARERELVQRSIIDRVPQQQLADEHGISRPRVNQIIKGALAKLKAELERKGVSSDRS